jgi:hypothetical protein
MSRACAEPGFCSELRNRWLFSWSAPQGTDRPVTGNLPMLDLAGVVEALAKCAQKVREYIERSETAARPHGLLVQQE